MSIVNWVDCGAKLSTWPFEALEPGSCVEVAMVSIEIMATFVADSFHLTDPAICLAPMD